jgi:hypothetical protein
MGISRHLMMTVTLHYFLYLQNTKSFNLTKPVLLDSLDITPFDTWRKLHHEIKNTFCEINLDNVEPLGSLSVIFQTEK